jgi:type IV secretory pathway VirJ component
MRRALPVLTLALFVIGASQGYALDGGRYGDVKIVEPPGPVRGLVIFFTGQNRFTAGNDATTAEEIAKSGALVAEIDTTAYIDARDKSDEKCYRLVGDAEALSRSIQRERNFPNYLTPILAGVGAGGTLAKLTLSEAPAVTMAGALAIDPAAVVASRQPFCTDDSVEAVDDGFRYGPSAKLPGFCTEALTPDASRMRRYYVRALEHAGSPCEIDDIGGNESPGDVLRKLIEPHLSSPEKQKGEISALPLIEMPVAHPSHLMAVVLSGDGGWRDLDKTIAENLQLQGVPVVGWDSLRYFWSKKTPDQTASALAAVIERYTSKWHTDHVVLIGYSFGADVLPFAYNRLPPRIQSQIGLIALLGLSKAADFQISLTGWMGGPTSPDALPIQPETDRIQPSLMQCFYGQNEGDTSCPALARRGIETIRTSGGHHFNGNYAELTDEILQAYDRRNRSITRVTDR